MKTSTEKAPAVHPRKVSYIADKPMGFTDSCLNFLDKQALSILLMTYAHGEVYFNGRHLTGCHDGRWIFNDSYNYPPWIYKSVQVVLLKYLVR